MLLSLGLLTTACGGDGDSDQVASVNQGENAADDSDKDKENDPQAFAACMRENGVDMEDPGEDGMIKAMPADGGADRETMREAMEACRKHMPQMGPGRGGERSEEQKEGMRKFAECMRDEGIEMSDPDGEGGLAMTKDLREEPGFEDAMEECRAELAGGGIRVGGKK